MSGAANTTEPRGRAYWVGMAIGLPVVLFGVVGALVNFGATHPVQFATWLVGADLVHDAIVAPAVGLVGWLVVKTVPDPWRAPVRAALIGSALVLAVGWAPLRGYGRIADNPSIAPLDYGTAVLGAIAMVWLAAAIWTAAIAIGRVGSKPVRSEPSSDAS